jgi:hypothetical protein
VVITSRTLTKFEHRRSRNFSTDDASRLRFLIEVGGVPASAVPVSGFAGRY